MCLSQMNMLVKTLLSFQPGEIIQATSPFYTLCLSRHTKAARSPGGPYYAYHRFPQPSAEGSSWLQTFMDLCPGSLYYITHFPTENTKTEVSVRKNNLTVRYAQGTGFSFKLRKGQVQYITFFVGKAWPTILYNLLKLKELTPQLACKMIFHKTFHALLTLCLADVCPPLIPGPMHY